MTTASAPLSTQIKERERGGLRGRGRERERKRERELTKNWMK